MDQTDPNVGMPGEFVWSWYQPWADRGEWENRYAVMSDADLLTYESISAAQINQVGLNDMCSINFLIAGW